MSALLLSMGLSACVSVGLGGDVPAQAQYRLNDVAAPVQRLLAPIVPALLIQPMPADATGDTSTIAYSRRPHEFAHYQFASWTERPLRQLPRLLQQRLEARGVAAAVGVIGEPMRADWLLTVAIDTLHHDLSVAPGQGRLALTAELFERRSRTRLARRQFDVAVPTASADAPGAAVAMSAATTQVFDQMLPWLEAELQKAAAAAPK
ncbi:MAG: ABC-type transport auxiliary lipoprotein family protein [Pseudomonadota bacterium]